MVWVDNAFNSYILYNTVIVFIIISIESFKLFAWKNKNKNKNTCKTCQYNSPYLLNDKIYSILRAHIILVHAVIDKYVHFTNTPH